VQEKTKGKWCAVTSPVTSHCVEAGTIYQSQSLSLEVFIFLRFLARSLLIPLSPREGSEGVLTLGTGRTVMELERHFDLRDDLAERVFEIGSTSPLICCI